MLDCEHMTVTNETMTFMVKMLSNRRLCDIMLCIALIEIAHLRTCNDWYYLPRDAGRSKYLLVPVVIGRHNMSSPVGKLIGQKITRLGVSVASLAPLVPASLLPTYQSNNNFCFLISVKLLLEPWGTCRKSLWPWYTISTHIWAILPAQQMEMLRGCEKNRGLLKYFVLYFWMMF